MKKIILIIILLSMGGTTLYALNRASVLRDAALAADSIAAAADTARALALRALDDSSTVLQRLIIQTRIEKDSIDSELKQRPVIRIPGEARVDTLFFTDTVIAISQDSIDTYDWSDQDGPFSIDGTAEIHPNKTGIFNARVNQVSSITIDTRISCIDRAGINSASIVMISQRPFNFIPGQVTQEPSVCNSSISIPSFKSFNFDIGTIKWAVPVSVIGGILIGKYLFDDEVKYYDYNPSYITISIPF